MALRLVDRLARGLEHRLDRRGFLARAAIGGTALAVAPRDFALRPMSAYAAICKCGDRGCGCGSTCCDGYTEFCCTIYGLNRCPPGALLGGWWKVDGSSFCGGEARYYMDCHATCNGCGCDSGGVCNGGCAGVGCGCAHGDCGSRMAGCVHFRYGQCNQDVPCVGPIICRLVSCVPPWQIDPTCTTSVAVDEGTRFHDAPCLHGGRGAIDQIANTGRQVRLTGWILDPNQTQPLQLLVNVNSAPYTRAVADRPRPDLVPFFPAAGPNHGFDLTITLPPGQHRIELLGTQTAAAADVVRLDAGTVSVGVPFGTVDAVSRVPGGVRVAGWVIDPDDGEGTPVHVYVNDRFTVNVAASLPRPDVAAAYPGFGTAHGFDVVVATPPGDVRICAYAYNVGQPGLNPVLGCRTVRVDPTPTGALDAAVAEPGAIRVVGWTLDPDTTEPLDVHVYVDGALVRAATADRPRPDIATAFAGYGPDHGFEVQVPADPGRHEVCVYAINKGAGVNARLGCATVTLASTPIGNVDVVARQPDGRVRVAGWAIDPDTTDPITVHVYADGRVVTGLDADRPRPDLAARFGAWGTAHGFDAVLDLGTASSVCVYAINRGPGTNALLACRSVS